MSDCFPVTKLCLFSAKVCKKATFWRKIAMPEGLVWSKPFFGHAFKYLRRLVWHQTMIKLIAFSLFLSLSLSLSLSRYLSLSLSLSLSLRGSLSSFLSSFCRQSHFFFQFNCKKKIKFLLTLITLTHACRKSLLVIAIWMLSIIFTNASCVEPVAMNT